MAMQPRNFDERMIVERDGLLLMLVRLLDGIGESTSTDCGRTWTPMSTGPPLTSTAASSSGGCDRATCCLLVKHHHFNADGAFCMDRLHLMAFLSKDAGLTWEGGLLLDDLIDIAYSDGIQAGDGRIYIIYDRDRFGSPEILMAVFSEKDVLEKNGGRLRLLVNRVTKKWYWISDFARHSSVTSALPPPPIQIAG